MSKKFAKFATFKYNCTIVFYLILKEDTFEFFLKFFSEEYKKWNTNNYIIKYKNRYYNIYIYL